MLNKNKTHRWLLALLCVAALTATSGCRSMPGRNMFGIRSGPSAEALAGNGPTSTYPAPPSASATPEAIASIAGGTGGPSNSKGSPAGGPETKSATTAQVAGFDISPGYATPASGAGQPNMSAAQANGIYNNGASGGSGKSVAAASGYTFGSKALTPKSEPPASTPKTSGASSYAKNSSYAPPADGFKTPSTSFTPPKGMTASTPAAPVEVPTPTDPVAAAPSGGYTLPTDSPAFAAIAPAKPDVVESRTEEESNGFAPPAAISPDFSTASAAASVTAPSVSIGTPTPNLSSGSSGYMPGSTSTDHGYPTGDVESTNGGSFYR
jgi:hypothetical protein